MQQEATATVGRSGLPCSFGRDFKPRRTPGGGAPYEVGIFRQEEAMRVAS